MRLKTLLMQLAYILPDKPYIKLLYRLKMKKKLNLKKPTTFNEKLQWLKLYDRNPLYTKLVDKYEVKKYVADKIGSEHVIKLLGVWDKFEEINFDKLPNQFVLKTNHGCGGSYICKDKTKLDKKKVEKTINKSLRHNYFKYSREWPYKNVKRRIIAEEYMVDESGTELKDYKFFCFNGKVKAMYVARDRNIENIKFDFFDDNFNRLPIVQHYPNSDLEIKKPNNFEEMKEFASELSKGIPQVRVDFYNINGKIYFGEFTFYHFGGKERFKPDKWDKTFGDWIDLSKAYIYKEKKNG
jgi:hypothetical protein